MKSLSSGMSGLLQVERYIEECGLPDTLLGLVRLRIGQINGCAQVVDKHAHGLLERGERQERVWSVAVWRDAPYFTPSERAALMLAETATQLTDNADGVSDDVWSEVRKHFDAPGQVALTLAIASMNAFSRIHAINQTSVGTNRSGAGGASCALPGSRPPFDSGVSARQWPRRPPDEQQLEAYGGVTDPALPLILRPPQGLDETDGGAEPRALG